MLTFRAGRALEAAYLGRCRVGYCAETRSGYLWNLSLLRPEGGMYMGRCETKELAHAGMESAVMSWVEEAGLEARDATTQDT